MKAGLRALLLIAGREPLASFLNKPFLHPSDHRDDEALVAHIKQWTQTEYHPVGTVRWVPTNARSWTPQTERQGLQGLRVVAEKATNLIKARPSRPPAGIKVRGSYA